MIKMICQMYGCKRKATWKAIKMTSCLVRKDLKNGYYCSNCKKYHQEKNKDWIIFEKVT